MENIPRKYKFLILVCIGILLILFLFSIFFSVININNNKILNGIFINGINVSNMTKEEAISAITDIINEKKENNINIEGNEYNTFSSFENLGIEYEIEKGVDEAINIGRNGNIFKNNFEILNLMINKKKINLNVKIDDDKLNNLIDEINANLPNKVIQNSYYIEENKLIITKGKDGEEIEKEDFIKKLKEIVNNLLLKDNTIKIATKNKTPEEIDIDKIYDEVYKEVQDAYYEENPFKVYSEKIGVSFNKEEAKEFLKEDKEEYEIELIYTYPKVTINDLDVNIFRETLGFFTTKYDPNNRDRQTNLILAAEKINGTVLLPGESFSYNAIVGARTIAAGYKEAKIYSNGQVVDGIGGGICQVSTTLYNAVIDANLNVTERYNHQFLTSYVDAGKDATVAYGVKDLKFVNNRTYPIKIEAKVENGIASCNIYGIKESTEYDVSLDVEILSSVDQETKYEYDNSIPEGEEKVKQYGSKGITCNTYKLVKKDGKIISRTLIYQDVYKPLEKIILKNSNG